MKSWIRMGLCLFALWVFIKFSPALLSKIGYYEEIVNNTEKLGIDNAALFYTEDPITSIAEQKLRDKLKTRAQ